MPGVTRRANRNGSVTFYVSWRPETNVKTRAYFPAPKGKVRETFERACRFRRSRERAHEFDEEGGRTLLASLRAVAPDYVRDDTRDELVQEMALALLDGRLTPEEVGRTTAAEYLRVVYRKYSNPRLRSLDEMVGDDWRLIDTLEG